MGTISRNDAMGKQTLSRNDTMKYLAALYPTCFLRNVFLTGIFLCFSPILFASAPDTIDNFQLYGQDHVLLVAGGENGVSESVKNVIVGPGDKWDFSYHHCSPGAYKQKLTICDASGKIISSYPFSGHIQFFGDELLPAVLSNKNKKELFSFYFCEGDCEGKNGKKLFELSVSIP
ncbi:MAG: hypothetical protein FD123_1591 [Bacteroidetes bacterium]|nr:MAG: hypothetical protein FD123_1591 [Bacteroidota bacterium]